MTGAMLNDTWDPPKHATAALVAMRVAIWALLLAFSVLAWRAGYRLAF